MSINLNYLIDSCFQFQVGVCRHTTAQHSLHPCTPVTPAKLTPAAKFRDPRAATAAAMTMDDDRDHGDDVTITTFGYETFESQLQQQFYPGV